MTEENKKTLKEVTIKLIPVIGFLIINKIVGFTPALIYYFGLLIKNKIEQQTELLREKLGKGNK